MCDCLVALGPATADGSTLFAKNSDRPPDEIQLVEVLERRPTDAIQRATHVDVHGVAGTTLACLVSRPAWCWGVEHGVNEAGVAIGNETIYTTLDPRPFPPALTGLDLVRLGLERASTAAEAVDVIGSMIERYGQGGTAHDPDGATGPKAYWSSFLIADPHAAFVVETSGRAIAVEAVERTRAISNRTTIPSFDHVHRHPRQPVERLVDPRLDASRRVLAHEPVTVQGLADHLRTHDAVEPGWSVCMHVPGVESTTASIIAELRLDGPHVVHMLTGSPCQQEYRTWHVGPGSIAPA